LYRFKFEISANGFLLKSHFSTNEATGLKWSKKYAGEFQRKVANINLRVTVSERENQAKIWQYSGKPYIYKKTLVKKPLEQNEKSENVLLGKIEREPTNRWAFFSN